MPKKTIAVLATLDTKGAEAHFLRKTLKELGSKALVVDHGRLWRAGGARRRVAQGFARGRDAARAARRESTREGGGAGHVGGRDKILTKKIAAGKVHGVIGLGGLQGTAACTRGDARAALRRAEGDGPTVASGDSRRTSASRHHDDVSPSATSSG
jgi:uncharacterized protein (UPF0261 family)